MYHVINDHFVILVGYIRPKSYSHAFTTIPPEYWPVTDGHVSNTTCYLLGR